jgi:hypothetical protein
MIVIAVANSSLSKKLIPEMGLQSRISGVDWRSNVAQTYVN